MMSLELSLKNGKTEYRPLLYTLTTRGKPSLFSSALYSVVSSLLARASAIIHVSLFHNRWKRGIGGPSTPCRLATEKQWSGDLWLEAS